jgi:CheY-like chemotaxis protein
MLKKLGYQVVLAESGRTALKLFEKMRDKIDLVILDMIMPDMGGSETFDQLKAMAPDIKVLLSSGYSIDGQASEIMKRGCNGFIQKPFNLKHFSQKVREILDE